MTPGLILALALALANAPPPSSDVGEPLPPGAPTDDYQLSAWCYGALKEYLAIYDVVKPDLIDIDRMFGTSVREAEPYQSDMVAARQELKMIGEAVTAAEKASPQTIAPQGALALRQGAGIWSLMETKPRRELARAWLQWALPDRCDTVSRQLATRSAVLGRALSYNARPSSPQPSADQGSALTPAPDAPSPLRPYPEPSAVIAQPITAPVPQAVAPAAAFAPPPSQSTPQAAAPPPAAPLASSQVMAPQVFSSSGIVSTSPDAQAPIAMSPSEVAPAPAQAFTATTPQSLPDAAPAAPAPEPESAAPQSPPAPTTSSDQPSEPLL